MKKDNLEFEKSTSIVFILSLIASGMNFLYQIIMGKLMSPADYGMLNTLLSLSIVISVPTAALTMASAKYSATYNSQKDIVSFVYKKISTWGLIGAAITLLVGSLFINTISKILKIDNKYYIFLILITVALSFIHSVNLGFLQGLKKFIPFSMVSIVGSLAKLVFGVLFFVIGFSFLGIVFSIVLSAVFMIIYSYTKLKNDIMVKPTTNHQIKFNDISNYFKSIFIIQFILLFFSNGDILLVKAFVSNEFQVGLYSTASAICKIPMFLATAVVSTFFTHVATAYANNKPTKKLYLKALAYSGAISLSCAIFITVLSSFIIKILYSTAYIDAKMYIVPVNIFIISLIFLTVTINYLNAISKTKFSTWVLSICSILMLITLNLINSNITTIVYIVSFWILLAFAICALKIFLSKYK